MENTDERSGVEPVAYVTEWVGLTDEEVYQAESGCWFMDEFDKTLFARAIEAKLKEKNG